MSQTILKKLTVSDFRALYLKICDVEGKDPVEFARELIEEQGADVDINKLKGEASGRQLLIADLKKLLGENFHIRDSEDFDGREGAIWISGESYSPLIEDCPFDGYMLNAHPKVQELLFQHGWCFEFYDSGTVFLYRD
jgi:hypothetical protein